SLISPSGPTSRTPMFVMYGTFQTPFSPRTRPRLTVPSASRGGGSGGALGPPRPPPVGALGACAPRDAATTHDNPAAAVARSRRPGNPFRTPNLLEVYGVVCWLDAANRRWPVDAIVTALALPTLLPSFALLPSTVTLSPTFIELPLQPWRLRHF